LVKRVSADFSSESTKNGMLATPFFAKKQQKQ
jgi:hypothetical protein